MNSLVKVTTDVEKEMLLFRQRRAFRYVILSINQETNELEIDEKGPVSATVEDFLDELPNNQCKFACYLHDFTTADGRKTDKVFAIHWAPLTAPPRQAMLYSSQKAALGKLLSGYIDMQASRTEQLHKPLEYHPE